MKNPIFEIENWREIGATLARNKTRTFLTAFGIFWGTAMLAMLWGGASGLEGLLRRQLSGLATNLGGVTSGTTSIPYKGFNKGMYWNMTDHDVSTIRRITPYLEYSSSISNAGVTAGYGTKTTSSPSAIGIESDYNRILIPVLYEGRLINASDVSSTRKVAVIGKNVAAELFGNESPVGKYVSLNGIYFLIVGVAGQSGEVSLAGRIDDKFLVPITTMRQAFHQGNYVGFMVFTVQPGHTPTELKPYIRRAICANHPIHPDDESAMYFEDMAENFEIIDNVFLGISLLALFVGFGSLMAGVIGVGNIMWIIVKERTQEIGIRRAIGAKPIDIIVQILSESMVLTTIAGIAGVCFASLVLGVVDHATLDPLNGSAHFELHFMHAVWIVVTFFVLGTAAGTIPAIKAMRIKPIEAMRDK